jgi:predicted metalloprotease
VAIILTAVGLGIAVAACGGGDSGGSESEDRDATREARREERTETAEARGEDETRAPDRERTPRPDATRRRSSSPTPQAREGELNYGQLIGWTLEDLVQFWEQQMPVIYGIPFVPLTSVGPYFISTGDLPQCGPDANDTSFLVGNAFYCPPEDYIAWDEEVLFPQIFNDHGDFSVALVLAHEYGHAIQSRGGATGPDILLELQADCFAGAWTSFVDQGLSANLSLSPGDIDEGVAGYIQFRDAPGTSAGSVGAHGSAFDRVNAFSEGFASGAERCADYVNEPPLVIPLQFTTAEEFESGGDLPFDEIAPLMSLDLEEYWTGAMPILYGQEWQPLAALGSYTLSDLTSLPSCGNEDLDTDFYDGNAFYCPADDYIAWDDEGLMRPVYDAFGDFAVALIIAHEWGHAVQARSGQSGTSLEEEQQADCFAGAWVASVILELRDNFTLSPGDLDEAISGFIAFGDVAGTAEDDPAARGTAFQRVAAFQNGVINGAEPCRDLLP